MADIPWQVIEPAIARVFLEQEVDDEEPSPLAVDNPSQIMDYGRSPACGGTISTSLSDAELHIYSVMLSKAMETSQPDQVSCRL